MTPVQQAAKELADAAHRTAAKYGLEFEDLNRAMDLAKEAIDQKHRGNEQKKS
jgi:hypothetical protein